MQNRNPFSPTTIALSALLLLSSLAATSCNTSANMITGYEKSGGGIATVTQISNPGLQKKIAIVNAVARRENDILRVSARIENRAKKTLQFEHKLQFLDNDGFEISGVTAHWTPAVIAGGDALQIQGMAPNPSAVTFKLLVREPEPVTN